MPACFANCEVFLLLLVDVAQAALQVGNRITRRMHARQYVRLANLRGLDRLEQVVGRELQSIQNVQLLIGHCRRQRRT
jgi:hypothetical protein